MVDDRSKMGDASRSTVFSPTQRPQHARVSSIDVARGAAMFFVCLSHFSGAYLRPLGLKVGELLGTISMIASPSFVLISGMTFGFIAALYPASLPHLRIRLLDRGVFLLLIGHFALALSQLRWTTVSGAYSTSFLTDALAVAVIIGPLIFCATSPWMRIGLALVIYCANWTMLARWHPVGAVAILERYVLGSLHVDVTAPRVEIFPVLPWLAVYLIGTVLGERVGFFYRRQSTSRARLVILGVGTVSLLFGTFTYVVTRHLDVAQTAVSRFMLATILTSPILKYPPGPTYIAFFGGAGLVFMWMVLELEARRHLVWLTESLRRVGYASLPVFLLQSFMYSTIVRSAHLPYSEWWPLLFICTLAPMWVLAVLWNQSEANHYLTVGITAWFETASSRNVHKSPLGEGPRIPPSTQLTT